MMDFESEIAKALLDSKVWDGSQSFFTTSTNTNTASAPLTFDDIAKLADELRPPPPPDKSRCENCKEPMHHDGHPIYAGRPGPFGGFFGPPACYVCGRCFYLFRQWARLGAS